MAKLSLTQKFTANFVSQLPDPEKPSVWKRLQFVARYKLFPQTEETRAELQRINDDQGNYGFLTYVEFELVETPKGFEFVDENDCEIPAVEWAKQHLIVQADAVLAFWETAGRGVKEKNSKRSR